MALAITGGIRGTSKEKFYQELSFESLKNRRWLRRLCYLYKIVNTKQPTYLYHLIPRVIKVVFMSHFAELCLLKIIFLKYAITEWNKLDSEIRNAGTLASFRKMFLNFIRPIENITYKIMIG